MRIPCDAYIEPWSQGARAGRAHSSLRPAVAKGSSVAVDRDEVKGGPRAGLPRECGAARLWACQGRAMRRGSASSPAAGTRPALRRPAPTRPALTHRVVAQARDVCLFVGKSPGSKAHLVCKVDEVVDIDARQVTDGLVGIRFAAPPVLLLVYNTRALLLEDFVRLLRKLTERRKIGTAVRFRYTPEQVLDSQRIEREQTAAVSTLQASTSASVPASVANAMGSLYASAARSAAPAVHLPTRTSPSSKSAEGAGRQSAFEEPLKTALDVRPGSPPLRACSVLRGPESWCAVAHASWAT